MEANTSWNLMYPSAVLKTATKQAGMVKVIKSWFCKNRLRHLWRRQWQQKQNLIRQVYFLSIESIMKFGVTRLRRCSFSTLDKSSTCFLHSCIEWFIVPADGFYASVFYIAQLSKDLFLPSQLMSAFYSSNVLHLVN